MTLDDHAPRNERRTGSCSRNGPQRSEVRDTRPSGTLWLMRLVRALIVPYQAALKAEQASLARSTVGGGETIESFARRWPGDYPRPRGSTNKHNAERVKAFAEEAMRATD